MFGNIYQCHGYPLAAKGNLHYFSATWRNMYFLFPGWPLTRHVPWLHHLNFLGTYFIICGWKVKLKDHGLRAPWWKFYVSIHVDILKKCEHESYFSISLLVSRVPFASIQRDKVQSSLPLSDKLNTPLFLRLCFQHSCFFTCQCQHDVWVRGFPKLRMSKHSETCLVILTAAKRIENP